MKLKKLFLKIKYKILKIDKIEIYNFEKKTNILTTVKMFDDLVGTKLLQLIKGRLIGLKKYSKPQDVHLLFENLCDVGF